MLSQYRVLELWQKSYGGELVDYAAGYVWDDAVFRRARRIGWRIGLGRGAIVRTRLLRAMSMSRG